MYNNGNSSKNVTGTSVVDGTLENADYPDNGLSGDKIDGGIISNFQSTGIDDRLSSEKAVTIDANENVSLNKGNLIVTSGKGIDFSATSDGSGTMTSEVLDDYEEGTFTPTIVGSTSGSLPLSSLTAKYVKNGNVVTATVSISNIDATAAISGNITLEGLPYSHSISTPIVVAHGSLFGMTNLYGMTTGANISFYQGSNGVNTLTDSSIAAFTSRRLRVTVTYIV
jgi:hypothetical protein